MVISLPQVLSIHMDLMISKNYIRHRTYNQVDNRSVFGSYHRCFGRHLAQSSLEMIMLRYMDAPTRDTLTLQERANSGFVTHSNGISEAKKTLLLRPKSFLW